jgi:hypothetical protein
MNSEDLVDDVTILDILFHSKEFTFFGCQSLSMDVMVAIYSGTNCVWFLDGHIRLMCPLYVYAPILNAVCTQFHSLFLWLHINIASITYHVFGNSWFLHKSVRE